MVIGIGEKTHISASNPFDDLTPHQQHPHQYHALHQFNQHQQQLPPPPHQSRPNFQYHAQYSTSTTTTTATTLPGTYVLLRKPTKNPNRFSTLKTFSI